MGCQRYFRASWEVSRENVPDSTADKALWEGLPGRLHRESLTMDESSSFENLSDLRSIHPKFQEPKLRACPALLETADC